LPPQIIDHRVYPVTINSNLNSHLNFPDLWDRRESCMLSCRSDGRWPSRSACTSLYTSWEIRFWTWYYNARRNRYSKIQDVFLLYNILEWKQDLCTLTALLSVSSPAARAYISELSMEAQVLASSIAERAQNTGS
jgi:hypothetical protein